jgi:predicted kinase
MQHAAGRLIIVCGLPGSGKTTVATALAAHHDAVRYSPDVWDDIRRAGIETLQWQQARHILALGGTAIIEWGTWGRAERDTLREGARALGATVELHFLDAPVPVLFDRIAARNSENPPITLEMLECWSAAFERPTSEELALYDPQAKAPAS